MEKETKTIPVRVSLRVDTFLLYAIQQVTKQSSVEILAFFNDLGREVAQIGAVQMKGRSIRKDIRDFYPNSPIPFKLLVTGRNQATSSRKVDIIDPKTGKPSYQWEHYEDRHFSGYVEVMFPEKAESFNSTDVDNKLLEKMLLDGDDMEAFKQPDPRTPKMFKDLIERVLNKA